MNRSTNPQVTSKDEANAASDAARLRRAVVTRTPSSSDNAHAVGVRAEGTNSNSVAELPPVMIGSSHVPTEGSKVFIRERYDGRYVVVGQRYDDETSPPTALPGERVIGNHDSDSQIRVKPSGDIDVQHESGVDVSVTDGGVVVSDGSGNTIELSDGTIVVNGGSTPVVTGVSTNTDADGHVTSVSEETTSSILV